MAAGKHLPDRARVHRAESAREAPRFFQELARNGTTTAMVYAAIYEDSCHVGFEAAERSGLRVILGKMMMDLGSYGTLQPKKVLSFRSRKANAFAHVGTAQAEGRLEYAFSPRFAVTCSEKLMRGAAELARKHGAYLQTHLAENREELEKGAQPLHVGAGLCRRV
jgi:guanine deaminase